MKSHLLLSILFALAGSAGARAADAPAKPNIIYILADDLGINDVGCYGQKQIQTPNIDRMAAEGMRFTQAYCGTTVCAPSRCSLMTGLHSGHAAIRGNRELPGMEGQKPMPGDTFTVAKLLKSAGYATGCIGKWGLGRVDSPSSPGKMGFDFFYGYNCQRMAHEYYPEQLWKNDEQIAIKPGTYSHDLFHAETMSWVRGHAKEPFFLYLAYTIPHAKLQVPDTKRYDDTSLTKDQKIYASMVSRLDDTVGALFALLKELKIDENTIVFFSGDNGASYQVFDSNGPFRGIKRGMYEGGLRQAAMVRWPGHIGAGKVVDDPWAFWDFLPTCAELSGAKIPDAVKTDGFSLVSGLNGGEFPKREFFYWELHEGAPCQAVRAGDWKLVRPAPKAELELYDLKNDPYEMKNIAADHADVVAKLEGFMKQAHVDSPDWPMTAPAAKPKGKGAAKASKN